MKGWIIMDDAIPTSVIPIHRHNTTTFIRNPIRIFDMDWYYLHLSGLLSVVSET